MGLRERARAAWSRGESNAAALCRSAVQQDPNDISAWNLLGEILRTVEPAAAERAWRQILLLDPTNAEANFHLGNLEHLRGETGKAIDHFERALLGAPGNVGILNNLGLALAATGDTQRAEVCFRDVVSIDPMHAEALTNLADVLLAGEDIHAARPLYERLFASRRDLPASAWVSRGLASQRAGLVHEAEAYFREAARLSPSDVKVQLNIGTICDEQKRYVEAEAAWLRALEIEPRNPYALSMLINGRQQRCAWSGLDDLFGQISQLLEADSAASTFPINPFTVLAMPSSPAAQLRAAQRWASRLAPPVPANRPPVALSPGERLRLGFVSSDFRDHPIAHLLIELWKRLDRSRIETFAYGIHAAEQGSMGRRIESAFDHFADVSDSSAGQIAQRIRADRVGVLFDLNGYTTNSREKIFALRPAPIQIHWLGYVGTLGADWYDYVVTDRFAAPAELQAFFTEGFLYLPDCYCPSDTQRAIAAPRRTREECGLPPRGFVFCCFNTPYKILPVAFDVWMRLLARCPGSVLWLSPGEPDAIANLRGEATARGVDPARLVFAPRVPFDQHLARHIHADLFLDTTPYNAGTTANDALFMGVPVITCSGSTMASRMAGSQLNAIGLPELVATDMGSYEALAFDLVRDSAQCAVLRSRLAANRGTQPLFDMQRFTKGFEDCITHVWENRVGASPKHD